MKIRFNDDLSFAGGVFCLRKNETVKLIYETNPGVLGSPVRPIAQSIYKNIFIDSHV